MIPFRRLTVARKSLHRRRHGLTLLEVLLSAGLGIVLLGGIYAAIEQSWRMSASGKIELERQQIARAVLRQITLDVRSAAFTAKPSGETNSGASGGTTGGTTGGSGNGTGGGTGAGNGSGGGASGSTEPTTVAGEEETEWTTSEGIRGTAMELRIDLSNPRYLSSLMAMSGQMPSDLQTVTYAVATPTSGTGSGYNQSTVSDRPDADGMGLMRSVAERSALTAVGDTSTTNAATANGLAKHLAQEVAAIQFRYFNGLAWMTEWDTIAMGALPRAIEVTIVFEPPQSRGVMTNSAVSIGTDRYRAVIPVPTSDPVLTEEAY
jgi:Tfp pilus assembly protein PilW